MARARPYRTFRSTLLGLAMGLAASAMMAPVMAAPTDDGSAASTKAEPAKPLVPPAKPVSTKSIRPADPKASATAQAAGAAQAERLKRINAAKSWGYQLSNLNIAEAAASPFDVLIIDATMGVAPGRKILPAEVEKLKKKPDGSRRLVISYLSVGEAEDYRADYYAAEYMSEDAPDWLGPENRKWKGNRVAHFCHEGWQRTIVGDDDGRNVYNSLEPSPLFQLLELRLDGIYLDRVDVYTEVAKECPDGANKMVDFVARIGTQARQRDPHFMLVLQNAEELTRNPKMIEAIDAAAKEDLFYGVDHSENINPAGDIKSSVEYLKAVKARGRPVFVIDYLTAPAKKTDSKRRSLEQGFIPYFGPRELDKLWYPGRDF